MEPSSISEAKLSNLRLLFSDIVSDENVLEGSYTQPIDPTLTLFLKSVKPQLIVQPNDVDEVLKIIEIANRYKIPLTPKSSSIDFRGDSSPLIGGIVVNFSKMNKILEVKPNVMDGVYARVEPGVTFRQLQKELKKHDAYVLPPARAPADVSVVSSYLNREILYTNYKHGFNIDDAILSMQVALGTGRLLYTGSYTLHYTGHGGTYPHTHGMDLGYFITGSLGTLGMVTKMNFKIKDLKLYPSEKILFMESKNLEELVNTCVEISRATTIEIGNVHLIMNKFSLASLLAKDKKEYNKISDNASDWTYVIRIQGENDWVACQEADLKDLAKRQNMELKESIAIQNADKTLSNEFNVPEGISRALNFNPFARVSFYSPKKKIDELYKIAFDVAKIGYKEDIGCVIIPIEQARSYYMEFEYYFDPNSVEQREMMKNLIKMVYLKAYDNGAFISVPREPFLQDHIFQKIQPYYDRITMMKKVLDPNKILHPGILFR